MKPFNVERAKAGDPVCFENGSPVRLICFNRIHEQGYHIVGMYQSADRERLISFDIDGRPYGKPAHAQQLFMAPKETGGWLNIYPDREVGERVYGTRAEADRYALSTRVDCIHIKWKE